MEPVSTVTRPRAKKGEGEHLRTEILEAAEQLLLETGSEDAVSIRAVADATGVTPPSIYRHFTDKQHLLFEVCSRHFSRLSDFVADAVADAGDPVAALEAMGRAYVRFSVENPEHYRILFMTRPAELKPETEIPAPPAFLHHVESVQRAQDAGVLRHDVDPMLAALTLWAGAHGITSLLIAKPRFPWPDLDLLIDTILANLVEGLTSAEPHKRARSSR